MTRIGIFGGTFDPVHIGHLILADYALTELRWDSVVFVPCNIPPHKGAVSAPASHRLSMLREAIAGNSRFEISTVELERGGVSYSVDTVKQLRENFGPETELSFLVGADSLLEMSTWKDPAALLEMASLAVVDRPGCDLGQMPQDLRSRVTLVRAPLIGVSSSEIRKRVKEGKSIRYIVPESTYRYIVSHRLYSGAGSGSAPGSS